MSPRQERTVPPGCVALARWAGWSADKVGRHVKCCRREWNGGALNWVARERGLYLEKLFAGALEFYVTADGAGLPT